MLSSMAAPGWRLFFVALVSFAASRAAHADAVCVPGPPVRPIAGAPAFTVFADCTGEKGQRLGIAVALSDATPPTRAKLDRFLRAFYAQVRRTMGRALPRKVELCVYRAGTTAWAPDFLGCIRRGYENELTEGTADDDDDEPAIENHAPLTPAEEVQRVQGLFGARPRLVHVVGDEPHHAMKVDYELRGARPTFVDAALAFFSVATRVYPAPTSLVTLDFTATWRGAAVLRVRVPDERAFLTMDPWAMRERLSAAGIVLDPTRPRSAAQTPRLERELRDALGRLPRDDVHDATTP